LFARFDVRPNSIILGFGDLPVADVERTTHWRSMRPTTGPPEVFSSNPLPNSSSFTLETNSSTNLSWMLACDVEDNEKMIKMILTCPGRKPATLQCSLDPNCSRFQEPPSWRLYEAGIRPRSAYKAATNLGPCRTTRK
jgi:hypothetical protein